MKTKAINFFLISILLVSLVASAAQSPQTLIELDEEVDSLWIKYPVIEFSKELVSDSNISKSQAGKSKHFLFISNYCQIFTETDAKISEVKINSGSAYEINSMYIIDGIVMPSQMINTEVYFKLVNTDYEAAVVDIYCSFPSEILTGSSDITSFFEIGLNNIANYYTAYSF